MRRIALVAVGLASLCACKGVRGSTVPIVDGQPVYPLHVHPSLSGAKPIPDARAPGRGTQGSPTSPPFVTTDYPDPPESASGVLEQPDAFAQPGPHPLRKDDRRHPR
jgi:hypothetical protein